MKEKIYYLYLSLIRLLNSKKIFTGRISIKIILCTETNFISNKKSSQSIIIIFIYPVIYLFNEKK